MRMLRLLFPRVIDNRFRGQWLGFGLLVPILVLKFGIAFGSMANPGAASKADAVDLSSFSQAALREFTTSTALIGLLHLCIGLVGLLAMIRYRALIPLVYVWLLLEFLARRGVLALYPIERTPGTSSGSIVNLALLAMLALGLILSLWPRRNAPAPA